MNKINLQSVSKYAILMLMMAISTICYSKNMDQNSKEEICSAIYIVEGKEKARQPFGIETIECKTYDRCEQICFNTVENNRIRFANQTKEKDFKTFLAKRYCPPNWKVWLKNLNFYLTKESKWKNYYLSH